MINDEAGQTYEFLIGTSTGDLILGKLEILDPTGSSSDSV